MVQRFGLCRMSSRPAPQLDMNPLQICTPAGALISNTGSPSPFSPSASHAWNSLAVKPSELAPTQTCSSSRSQTRDPPPLTRAKSWPGQVDTTSSDAAE